jgi:glutamate/tyrosine decarboxylase-like PLP-dependent enzyme
VALNIVCFRVRDIGLDGDIDRAQLELVADLQESGIAVPSTTRISGHTVIRVAIVNHRSTSADIELLVQSTLQLAARHRAPMPLARAA